MERLISVTKAENIVLRAARQVGAGFKPVSTDLSKAYGSVLAENIFADRDQPSTDRSSMDGIAISYSAWQKGIRTFRVSGMQRAGISQKTLRQKSHCWEVMTGAVIPKGADCIVPIEAVDLMKGKAFIKAGAKISRFQFIRKQGSEYRKGTLLLKKHTELKAAQIAVAGSVGKNKIKIFSPHIAVIGTGDELVEINKSVKPYQSRRSNAYALAALLKLNGFSRVGRFHFNDNARELRNGLKKILNGHDVVILSGGVSMGKFDFIPQVLKKLGVKVLFYKVSQKPGKPFWFGLTKKHQPVFALPGNPVSTQVCAYRYALPYLKKASGLKSDSQFAILGRDIPAHSSFTLFVPVNLKQNFATQILAVPVSFAGSGDYAALTKADGFIELPARSRKFQKGEMARLFQW